MADLSEPIFEQQNDHEMSGMERIESASGSEEGARIGEGETFFEYSLEHEDSTLRQTMNNKKRKKKKHRRTFSGECRRLVQFRWKWLLLLLGGTSLGIIAVLPSSFTLWVFLNLAGFAYVAVGTEERKDPFISRRGDYREIAKLLFWSPVVYWLAPAWTLLDPEQHSADIVLWEGVTLDGQGHSIAKTTTWSWSAYVCYTTLAYALPFFIGLHFTYLDFFPWFQKIVLRYDRLQRLHTSHWVFLISTTLVALVIVGYQAALFWAHGLFAWYLACILLFLFYFVVVIVVATKKFHMTFHLHHYQLFGALLVLTRFQNIFSAILQALLAGVYVEGVSRWGMDPFFV